MKKINKSRLFDRMRGKFDLTDIDLVQPVLIETVQPVTNIDILAKKTKQYHNTAFTVSATGHKLLYTVPTGKRLTVHSISARKSTGTFTISLLSVVNTLDTSSKHQITPTTASASVILYTATSEFVLEEGCEVYVYVDSYSAEGYMEFSIWGQEEDAF